ncbi:MAG: Gfo/Idh/MocA family oxidoreductase [Balneolaceae bacterium]|nr:Gfo/Idh/MocA family oxidoreductase [Balneolaceae bacterium]
MSNKFDRKDFLKMSTAGLSTSVLAGMSLSKPVVAKKRTTQQQPIRLGFVGIGGRGTWHLSAALGIEGVKVPAISEIRADRLENAKNMIEASGRPSPTLYGQGPNGETDFVKMSEEEDLDAIICATSWKWHAPICLAAMNNDKHVACEVPLVLTLDEAWKIVETYEKTGKWASTVLGGFPDVTLLNMIRKGLFGEVLHIEDGYVHDLRFVKNNVEREPWRLQHSIDRNGNLYPDHPMRTIMPAMDINHGDRIDFLVSMSSKAVMLNRYAAEQFGPDHPDATRDMNQGDYNASLIRTVNGKMITLNFDTNTPHPRESFRLQGSKGVYEDGADLETIYLEGPSPESHEWESAEPYLEEYEHPMLKNYNPPPRIGGAIEGHGRRMDQTPINWHNLITAINEGIQPYIDTYDSVTSSAVSAVTEASVANNGRPVDFPDFTKGKWKERTPIFMDA